MNKLYKLLLIFLIANLLLACSNNDVENDPLKQDSSEETTTEQVENNNIKKPLIKTDGKEEVKTDSLKDKSLITFEFKQRGKDLTLYLYDENEKEEKVEAASFIGIEGDIIASGNYSFYLAEKGGSVAYKQSQIAPIPFSMNKSGKPFNVTELEDEALFTLLSPIASSRFTPDVYLFKNGEIHETPIGDELGIVFSSIIKHIDDNLFQAVRYEIGEDIAWNFITFSFDSDTANFEIMNELRYSNNEVENRYSYLDNGHTVYLDWASFEHIYVPYRDNFPTFSLDKSILGEAIKGTIWDVPVTIGENIETVFNRNRVLYDDQRFHRDLNNLSYHELDYGYYKVVYDSPIEPSDEKNNPSDRIRGKIEKIIIPHEIANVKENDVIKILGQPDDLVFTPYGPDGFETLRYNVNSDIVLDFIIMPNSNNKVEINLSSKSSSNTF